MPMLQELVMKYEPEVIWADGDWERNYTYWKSEEFLAWLYNDSPVKDVVCVNDRWGIGTGCKHGGYYTCSDRYNPGHLVNHKWENCNSIDLTSWGYSRNTNITNYMTINDILFELISTVSFGGNLLLNIGPASDGTIHPIFQERLLQLGSWMQVNGEAIYNTTPWRAQNQSTDVYYTTSGDSVYAIFITWPDNDVLTLQAPIPSQKAAIQMLGYGELSYTYTNEQLSIDLSSISVSQLPCQWAWAIQMVGVS